MSCLFHSRHSYKPHEGEVIRSQDKARSLLVGSIVISHDGFAWQRFVHGWACAGVERRYQLEQIFTDKIGFLPVRVIRCGNVVVHGIDCTCNPDSES